MVAIRTFFNNVSFVSSALATTSLKLQNCFETRKKPVYANETAKQWAVKFEEIRKKYGKSEKDNETNITDVISAVSSKHPSINLSNIGELTIYQIMDCFKRLNKIENYTLSFEALIHGASKDDVKLEHWSEKLK